MRRHVLPTIVILPTLFWSTTASAGKRFCLRLPPDNTYIYDASPRPGGFDYLEDYGRRNGDDWGIPGMWAYIETTSGTVVWGSSSCFGGFCLLLPAALDNSGCTPFVNTPGGTAAETFRIRYFHSGSFPDGSSYTVYNCASTNPYYPSCATATNVIEDVYVPAGVSPTHYENLSLVPENLLAWEIAFSMKRFPLPSTPVAVKYYNSQAASEQGVATAASWGDDGNPQIAMTGTAYRSKWVLAHEYGHVYSVFRNASLSPSDVNYCYLSGTCQHSITSAEYQAAAAMEGFADFLGVAVWNDLALNSVAYIPKYNSSTTGSLINLETGHTGFEAKYYETQICSGTCLNGIGVELDWARTFWDFHTNYSSAPSVNSTASVFEEIYPWTVSGMTKAYYTEFRNGVESVMGSTWESQFVNQAQANGVDW